MSERQLETGEPVPEDGSHATLRADGQQEHYIVLSPEERAKGFVKPVRTKYRHIDCGHNTTMSLAIAETYARNPSFYSGTFCCHCAQHYPLTQFRWLDGEPMEPSLQADWHAEIAAATEQGRQQRIAALERELAELKAGP